NPAADPGGGGGGVAGGERGAALPQRTGRRSRALAARGGDDDMTAIALVVNGDAASAMGRRARAFAERLAPRFDVHVLYRSPRKLRSLVALAVELLRLRPRVCYVLGMAYSGVGAAGPYR